MRPGAPHRRAYARVVQFPSDDRFLVLHGLRVKGLAEADRLAGVDDTERRCKELEAEGLVQHRDGVVSGWRLTPDGRREHDRLLADELERSGARSTVESAYRRFLVQNRPFLELCTDWQQGTAPDALDRLDDLHVDVRAVVDDLAASLERFAPYGERFDRALARVRAGDLDHLTRPLIDSYHTIWSELHEDLLSTLGIARGSEHVS
jgi:hypothetical protein